MQTFWPTLDGEGSPGETAAMVSKKQEIAPVVLISTTQRRLRVPTARIKRLVAHIGQAEGRKLEQIDIAIVGRRRMATLNEQYLGHEGPTDVISFDLGDGPAGGLCAQLIVCSDVAEAQARLRGHDTVGELLLYITHGLLHAIGYDDDTAARSKRMHERENELLETFGAGRLFGKI